MAKLEALNLKKVELLINNWNEQKANARDELISYVYPWFQNISEIAFVKNKNSLNTAMKIFSSQEDLANDVIAKLLHQYPDNDSKQHTIFLGVDDFITTIRMLMFNEIDNKVKKLTNPKNSIVNYERVLSIPKDEVGLDMKDYDTFISFSKLYKELSITHRKKLLAYDLKVFHGHTQEEVALILKISTSSVKNYIRHIELLVLERLRA